MQFQTPWKIASQRLQGFLLAKHQRERGEFMHPTNDGRIKDTLEHELRCFSVLDGQHSRGQSLERQFEARFQQLFYNDTDPRKLSIRLGGKGFLTSEAYWYCMKEEYRQGTTSIHIPALLRAFVEQHDGKEAMVALHHIGKNGPLWLPFRAKTITYYCMDHHKFQSKVDDQAQAIVDAIFCLADRLLFQIGSQDIQGKARQGPQHYHLLTFEVETPANQWFATSELDFFVHIFSPCKASRERQLASRLARIM